MIILTDAVKLFETIAFHGVERARDSDVYRVFLNVVRNHGETPVAIPYWCLVDELDRIDYVLHDNVPGSPVYDVSVQCFVFKSVFHMFRTLPHIVQAVQKHFPHEHQLTLRNLAVTRAMGLLNEEKGTESELDELCGLMERV